MKLAALALVIALSGCATRGENIAAGYAICSAVDVTSTILALNNGAVEANPLWAAVIDAGGYPLFIAANVAIAYIVYKHREKKSVQTAGIFGAALRCAAGAANSRFF